MENGTTTNGKNCRECRQLGYTTCRCWDVSAPTGDGKPTFADIAHGSGPSREGHTSCRGFSRKNRSLAAGGTKTFCTCAGCF